MRAILTSMLLIIAVILIYTSVAEGDDGMKNQINKVGGTMGEYIEGMSP
ncbi:hypothetical protein I6N90_20320 [Paenibacillus sp. GSMTC-2017]|nr:hypothetical protein [Paenibacillus sp. GSMTC-2017]MBH5320154.1 hypothetical protein [Paenibacillus sp. GSMTC-2017]